MKIRSSRRQIATISNSRWLAYATAGAATALAGTNFAEAAIHYSGRVGEKFTARGNKTKSFQLDQPGRSIRLGHGQPDSGFATFGFVEGAIRGVFTSRLRNYVSKLSFGQSIAAMNFYYESFGGVMANSYGGSLTQWGYPGVGFVGFRFYTDAGYQYGWARVRMGGTGRNNAFRLLDYAYADPGEAIRAGEGIPAGEDGQDMSDEQAPDEGSLGGLALGAVGLLAWRKSRSRTARLKDA